MKKKTEQEKQPSAEMHPATLRRFLQKNYLEKGTTLYLVGRVTLSPGVMLALKAGNPGPLCEFLSQMGPQCLTHVEVRPASKLPEELRQELKEKKPEILALLQATAWLRSRLSAPQRIAPLIAEWVGPLDNLSSRDISIHIDKLMDARWTLGVAAYEGEDGRFWWRLPHDTVQGRSKGHGLDISRDRLCGMQIGSGSVPCMWTNHSTDSRLALPF
jgi:hypothetical protein